MIKKEKIRKNNIVKFPSKLTDLEKEIEAVIFAAAEPLDIDTIESKYKNDNTQYIRRQRIRRKSASLCEQAITYSLYW